MPRGLPGGGGWAVLELTGTLLIDHMYQHQHSGSEWANFAMYKCTCGYDIAV